MSCLARRSRAIPATLIFVTALTLVAGCDRRQSNIDLAQQRADVGLTAPAPAASMTTLTDDEFVSVLSKDGKPVVEDTIAVSPIDPKIVVAGGIWLRGNNNENLCVAYRSEDGGVTWTGAQVIPFPDNGKQYNRSGDPVLAVDRGGVFYYAYLLTMGEVLPGAINLIRSGVAVSRSLDGGRTWEPARLLVNREQVGAPSRLFDDKEWIVVDNSGGARDGTIYVHWQIIDNNGSRPTLSSLVVSKSTDRGLTWSEPRPFEEKRVTGCAFLAVGPGGELVSSSTDAGGYYRVRVSTDGGETWGLPLRGPEMRYASFGNLPNTSFPMSPVQSMAIDHSLTSHRGRLYFAYPGGASQTQGTSAAVLFRYSTDLGRTWSEPLRLGGDPVQRRDALLPSVTADPHTGDVIVAWLDRRDDPNNALARLYAARSRDGGRTFEPARPYSPPFSLNTSFIGEYNQVSSQYGRAVATFSDATGAIAVARLPFCQSATDCGGARGARRRRW
ncbi:MAG TPA: sialidase family protein [Pyrinomonadaceae bacterium]